MLMIKNSDDMISATYSGMFGNGRISSINFLKNNLRSSGSFANQGVKELVKEHMKNLLDSSDSDREDSDYEINMVPSTKE